VCAKDAAGSNTFVECSYYAIQHHLQKPETNGSPTAQSGMKPSHGRDEARVIFDGVSFFQSFGFFGASLSSSASL
jgi:hypothetical protein